MIRVTCGIILKEGRVLAALRSQFMARPLKWEFPGGKIESGESEEECLIREISEEIGIRIQILRRLPSHIHHYSDLSLELIPFLCEWKAGEFTLKEHADAKWFDPGELKTLDLADADIPILEDFLVSPDLG